MFRVRAERFPTTDGRLLLCQSVWEGAGGSRGGTRVIPVKKKRWSHVLPGLLEDAAVKVDEVVRPALGEDRFHSSGGNQVAIWTLRRNSKILSV